MKDVRSSERLTGSAVCLVADEGDLDMHLERLLKQHRQPDTTAKRILELNPRHKLVDRLARFVRRNRRLRSALRIRRLRPQPRDVARTRLRGGGVRCVCSARGSSLSGARR